MEEMTERFRPTGQDEGSVDAILDNLAKRPGVKSTLILARKDGSIIKASGMIVADNKLVSKRQSMYGMQGETHNDQSMTNDPTMDNVDDLGQKAEGSRLTPAQILAASIYSFVVAATTVSEALAEVDGTKSAFAADETQALAHLKGPDALAQPDTNVQLLRLRLRKQEVIIFPDPSYLCCVVQDLERTR